MKFARLKQYTMSVAFALSIVFSFSIGMPTAAMSTAPMDNMEHEGTDVVNCINLHHATPSTVKKTVIDEFEDEDDEPAPLPPYFTQFQTGFVEQRQAAPTDIIRSSSYRPPDITRLTCNLRF